MGKLTLVLVLGTLFTACGYEPQTGSDPDTTGCVPQCAGKTCGDDGCGGECGMCQNDQFCQAGNCQFLPESNPEVTEPTTEVAVEVTPETTAEEEAVPEIEEVQPETTPETVVETDPEVTEPTTEVAAEVEPEVTNEVEPETECVPQCGTNECGDDGCGGECGVCNDNSACTMDVCDNGTCRVVDYTCNDGSACTVDTCDPETGCVFTPVNCDDGFVGTQDVCDPETGTCVNTPTPCVNEDKCQTVAWTQEDGCIYTTITCEDGNACSTDLCNNESGECEHTFKQCDDGLNYTDDTCNPETGGCEYVVPNNACLKDSDCEDGNPCTKDICNSFTNRCKLVEVVCEDNNPCTVQECVPAPVGVLEYVCETVEYKDCDDNDNCTWDWCDPETGACQHQTAQGCCKTDEDCNGDQWCNTDDGGQCWDLFCPSDACGGYYYGLHRCEPWTASEGTPCDDKNPDTPKTACDGMGSCVLVPLCTTDEDCNDGDAGTTDTCDKSEKAWKCIHTPVSCDDGDKMTEDWFDQATGSCAHTTAAFAVWCTIPVEWQATGRWCEVWVSFGGIGQDGLPQDMAWFKESGEKIPAENLCYSWWYPTAAELNVRVFGTGIDQNTAPWVGGSYAQMTDPSGGAVQLVETNHGYPDTPNWGTPTDGIPWCE